MKPCEAPFDYAQGRLRLRLRRAQASGSRPASKRLDILFLVKGFAIGLSIAAPVGPIGVLCIRRTLEGGRASGLVSGLGAATADGLYGAVAAFGLTAVSDRLIEQQDGFRLVGGAFLLYLGLRSLLTPVAAVTPQRDRRRLLGDYASTLALTLANPATILSFAAVFAGLGLAGSGGGYGSAGLMVAGVAAGSATWWFVLSSGVSLLRSRFEAYLPVVNRVSGPVIGGFGVLALVSLA